jgi:peptide/nickel transport system ATP-binding protein
MEMDRLHEEAKAVLEVKNVRKYFRLGRSFGFLGRKSEFIRAVDGISFKITPGEIFGLLGESGCGKTTTARLIVLLDHPDSGNIFFDGKDINSFDRVELKRLKEKIAMVFQDPYSSMNDLMEVRDIVSEPLVIQGKHSFDVERAIRDVQLEPVEDFINKRPKELSGGQRQRVAIARAIIKNPKLIVADEPVSMLDVSIRAVVLKLLLDLRTKYKFSCLFITHDFSVARQICDRIGVMYLGKIVEMGRTESVLREASHPYLRALLSVVPIPKPGLKRSEMALKGDVLQTAVQFPQGCRFHPRCPFAREICEKEEPKLRKISRDHYSACHIIEELPEFKLVKEVD